VDEPDLREKYVPYDNRATFDRACSCLLVLMIAVSAAILAHASCRYQQTAATGVRFSLH
jgi:hypothetical protein